MLILHQTGFNCAHYSPTMVAWRVSAFALWKGVRRFLSFALDNHFSAGNPDSPPPLSLNVHTMSTKFTTESWATWPAFLFCMFSCHQSVIGIISNWQVTDSSPASDFLLVSSVVWPVSHTVSMHANRVIKLRGVSSAYHFHRTFNVCHSKAVCERKVPVCLVNLFVSVFICTYLLHVNN